MKDEETVIEACYIDMIKPIFTTFYTGMMDKKLSPADVRNLENRFTAGVALARQVRDRAIKLLP